MSAWRQRARTAIALAIAQAQTNGADAEETVALIDAAYPFGERRYHPYKVWLAERKLALQMIDVGAGGELLRPCPACGASSGRPCRPIGDDDITSGSHATRLAPIR